MTQLPKIITSFVYPPIPVRDFDWCAYRDGCEEDGNYGYGRTEAEAVADLLDNEEMLFERDADQAAHDDAMRASIEASYEDERRRKGGYSLRAAAARIADSSTEYEG